MKHHHYLFAWAIFAALLISVFSCHDVTPEKRDSVIVKRPDTIRDTVYKSYVKGKLFGVEINTYVKRKGIWDY